MLGQFPDDANFLSPEAVAERYAEFWHAHGNLFKAGYMDFLNKDKFSSLVRFNSSANEDAKGLTSFEEYISRAKEDQKEIYYAYGPSREALGLSPYLEVFRRKGIECGLCRYRMDAPHQEAT